MDWLPAIAELGGPIYLRIVEALAQDIARKRLARGQQLPTQRALSQALGIDLTTVTRAYREARRRGLITARTGQGTFVSETTARAAADIPHEIRIDLSMNVPPQPVEADLDMRISRGLDAVRGEASFTAYLNYQRPGGTGEERALAAAWLGRRVATASPDRLILFAGNQPAIFSVLLAETVPGDVVLTEALTFPGLKAAAARLGVRLVGVESDAEGVRPDALAEACRQWRPKLVYLVPTYHNPTTATAGPARRRAIAEAIENAGVRLFEDDAYGLLAPDIAPVADLIPQRSYLAVSLSKAIAPALRVSFLLVPDSEAEARLCGNLQATVQMPPPLMVALVMLWLRTGVADAIVAAIRDEARGRQHLAARILGEAAFSAQPASHHLWLPLPRHWNRAEFVSEVRAQGLLIMPSDAFALAENPPHAVRVSLGAARNRADLAGGLTILERALRAPPSTPHVI